MAENTERDFMKQKHVKFFTRCLSVLPDRYASMDTTRYVLQIRCGTRLLVERDKRNCSLKLVLVVTEKFLVNYSQISGIIARYALSNAKPSVADLILLPPQKNLRPKLCLS